MSHGFSAIKEMRLDDYAEVFCDAGLACVVYDNRGFGASDAAPGKPRQEIDPWEQIRDYQHAITYAQLRPDVDADRIGVWGSSYSGAHAYVVAAIDRRVKAVCGQVPLVSGRRAFEMLVRIDFWEPTWEAARSRPPGPRARRGARDAAGRRRRPDGAVRAADAGLLRVLHGLRGHLVAQRGDAAQPRAVPGLRAGRVPQAHLADAAADGGRAERPPVAGELACEAYETAAHPKKLVLVPGGHFDAYVGRGFEISSGAARDWFVEHLLTAAEVAAPQAAGAGARFSRG